MHARNVTILLFLFILTGCREQINDTIRIGKLTHGEEIILKKENNQWGIWINSNNLSAVKQNFPVGLEIFTDSVNLRKCYSGYREIQKKTQGFTGFSSITCGQATFNVTDNWSFKDNVLTVDRQVTVEGSMPQSGFLSAVKFSHQQPCQREQVKYFAPGMIYGSPGHLSEMAIGGKNSGTAIWIREDRLPAPLFGIHHRDGSAVTILHLNPEGTTIREDSRDLNVKTIIDKRFRFGAPGAEEENQNISLGFVWPGTEGEITYRGKTYPGGQMKTWRRRYHPIEDGMTQQYRVSFRFDQGMDAYTGYVKTAWRWAWEELDPKVSFQDIEQARRSLVDMLGDRVQTVNGFTGIPYFMTAVNKEQQHINEKTAMGFVGKALESANYLLQDADRQQSPNDEKHRKAAEHIINSFVHKLTLSPPNGEGFMMNTGEVVMVRPQDGKMYLRSFGDGLKALLRAVKRKKQQGLLHEDWLRWAQSFGDWLLPQQQPEGGFPRGWEQGTGKIVDDSPQSSYAVIPYLMLLSELTGEEKYKKAAIRAADFCWETTQSKGIFVGGTIDNPDVIDKEAGTLSAEAYLSIYESDKQQKWIDRAQAAADYAETWIYLWNIPMPEEEDNELLPWKKGVSTVGQQLISTGHSLTDAYMAFDTDEYAKLFRLTADSHYYEVARILLHNTKSMLALPGRTYDLHGPGWQQEHWSMAPMRGYGLHRGWLPWVSTSHLNGIFGLEEYDPELFQAIKNPE